MKIQEYLNEMKTQFHLRHGYEFGFEPSQSEAYFDLTSQAAMSYIQGLAMSGKIGEIKDMVAGGEEAVKNSSYYQELLAKITESYYGLDWDTERKNKLAQTTLGFIIEGLKNRFEEGGYSKDLQGVLQFAGLDSGVLGMLGKMGGMFGGLGKWFK